MTLVGLDKELENRYNILRNPLVKSRSNNYSIGGKRYMKLYTQFLKGYLVKLNPSMYEDDKDEDDKGDQEDDEDGDGDDGEPEKKFSQEDIDRIAGKTRKETIERFAKEFDMTKEEATEALKNVKTAKEKDMTESQKLKKQLDEQKEAQTAAEKKAEKAERKVSLMAKKIPSDKHDDVILLAEKLVDDTTTFDQAVAKILEKYPSFSGESEEDLNIGSGGRKKSKGEKVSFKRRL